MFLFWPFIWTFSNDNNMDKLKIRTIQHYEHHNRQQLCQTRSRYRQGRKLTAIKVFTIADESRYILIQKVPKLSGVNVREDLREICEKFGKIEQFELVNYPDEEEHRQESFENIYLIKYDRITDAIRAKKHLDDREFLGSILHVCYSPEHETTDDIQKKLSEHKRYVDIKLAQYKNLLKKKKKEN